MELKFKKESVIVKKLFVLFVLMLVVSLFVVGVMGWNVLQANAGKWIAEDKSEDAQDLQSKYETVEGGYYVKANIGYLDVAEDIDPYNLEDNNKIADALQHMNGNLIAGTRIDVFDMGGLK